MSHTFDQSGSLLVHILMLAAVTGEFSSASIRNTVSPGVGTEVDASGSGRQLKTSALACCSPGLYEIT